MGYHVNSLGTSLERIASTSKLNSAADNPAGIGIYQRWMARLGGLTVAQENAQNGISILQTANTSLDSIYSLLNDCLDLAIDAQEGTLQPEQRVQLNTQLVAKLASIDELANTTQYNEHYLLNVPDWTNDWTFAAAPQGGTLKVYVDDTEITADPINGYSLAGSVMTMNGNSIPKYWEEVEIEFTASAATPTLILGNTPDYLNSVEVRVNNVVQSRDDTNGWNLSGNTLSFNGTAQPGAGDVVKLTYNAGSTETPIQIQMGATGHSSERYELPVGTDVRTAALDIDAIDITTIGDAEDAEDALDDAIDTITNLQAILGTSEDFLTGRIDAMAEESEHVSDAASRLYDADMTIEITNQTLYEAMTQAATNAITTANSLQGTLMQLLGITSQPDGGEVLAKRKGITVR